MTGATAFLGFLVLQRLAELAWARRNAARARAAGAVEHGGGHYPAMVAMHAGFLAVLVLLGRGQPVHPAWLAVFALLQLLRLWILASLGERWNTRILVWPGRPLVARGPYRWTRHPNYALVAAEIAVAPLVLGLPGVAAIFTLLNTAMLGWRMRAEDRALGRR